MRKDIPGYEGLYQAHPTGIVRSLDRIEITKNPYNGKDQKRKRKGRIMKPCTDTDGYLVITMCKDGKPNLKKISRMVAITFLPNPDNLPQVNHEDGNKLNNDVSNLKWCTSVYNIKHARANGLSKASKGGDKWNARKVNQYTSDGVFIRTWDCMTDAERELGVKRTSIGKVCRGEKYRTGGFRWKYSNKR